jgi:hypothetical protein
MQFSEKENAYYEYQARENFLRQQRSMQKGLDAALEAKAVAIASRDEALAELARLKALLEA